MQIPATQPGCQFALTLPMGSQTDTSSRSVERLSGAAGVQSAALRQRRHNLVRSGRARRSYHHLAAPPGSERGKPGHGLPDAAPSTLKTSPTASPSSKAGPGN
jgi:hypothetical protein